MPKHCGTLLLLAALSLCCALPAAAQPGLDLTGTWARTINAADLLGGAGTDLAATYESAPNQLMLGVTDFVLAEWRVSVSRSDTTWDDHLTLAVRRTGDGVGLEPPTGGLDYLPVGPMDTPFFSGDGPSLDVPLQLRLGGVSVTVPPNTYSTTLTFTVVDTL
jgi:hypothetical protein